MTFEEVEKNWKAGKAKPVYVFHGEEEFLRSELLHTAPALFVPDEGTRSFNFDLLYGAETNLQNVLSLAQSYPVMAERRLLIVREADKIMKSKASTSASKKKTAKSEDLMVNYLASPQPETVLIFDMTKMGPKNTNPWKELAAKAEIVEFPILKEPQIIDWLRSRAKKEQKLLAEKAARLMVGHLGTSLRTHANELEKLITFVGERGEITEQDVEQVVGVSRSYNVFELTKAIGSGDKAKSAEIIIRMLAQDKDQRHLLFVMIARYFEQLIITQEMLIKGEKEAAIAEAIDLRGGAAFFVREFIAAAKRYRRERLDHAMRSIVEAESTTRRVQLDDTLIFERLLTQIMPA
ncbi:MAG TPA: DNA polymerase III subunit delta [Candidatus Kapabacteria bacterium]|nr:DNA polymerase III subunit delta [Candidatus Kapabacteria bacterium]